MKVLSLCSGGLDSVLATMMLEDQGHEVIPVHIDFEQKTSARETGRLMHYFPGKAKVIKWNLASVLRGWAVDSDKELDREDRDKSFIPGRNILMLLRLAIEG